MRERRGDVRVDEVFADPESARHTSQRHAPIALQQLTVRLDPHLPHVVPGMGVQKPGGNEVALFDFGEVLEEGAVFGVVD